MANKKLTRASKAGGDEFHPFGLPWLDSAYQETLLPNGPWQNKVNEMLCEQLVQSILQQFDIPERRQIIFEMVGPEFVRRYFPNVSNNPWILESMKPEARKKMEIDAHKWLYSAVQKAASAVGCSSLSQAQLNGETQSAEMEEFVNHTKQIVQQALDRHLYLKEDELIKKWETLEGKQRRSKMAEHEFREYDQLRREHNRLRGDLRLWDAEEEKPSTSLSSAESTSSKRQATTLNVKGALFGSKEDPPMFWGIQSNSIGRSIMAILRRDPRRLSQLMKALQGRQLPGSLRSYVWMDVLLKSDRDKLKDSNTEKILRERFAQGIKRGLSELKIRQATLSPISGLIDNTVTEVCDSVPAMALYVKDTVHLREASHALNILYVYSRVHEPYLVHWLFPLQLALKDGSGEAEHAYELAMYLDLLNRNFLLKAPQIFAVAERAMSKVKAADPEFYRHLKTIAQKNPTINPKEFLVDLIHVEKSKAEELLTTRQGLAKSVEGPRQLLTDPLIFLRKWLGEGFVGILDTQAVIFVWDQLFMQRWSVTVAEDICLALLFLLRNKFMSASEYSTMKQVFLKEPCKLLTMDLQKAWIHVQEHRSLIEIPSMNRMLPSSGTSARSPSIAPSEPAVTRPLDAAAMKILGLELIFPASAIEKLPDLAEFDPARLRIASSVYFGSVELASKNVTLHASVKSREPDENGSLKYVLEIKDDDLPVVFANLDLSNYDLEQEMGSFPKAAVRLSYLVRDSAVSLGWAETALYRRATERTSASREMLSSRLTSWTLMVGDRFCDLSSGRLPDVIAENADDEIQFGGLISEGSKVHIRVVDPRRSAKSVLATTTPKMQSRNSAAVTDTNTFDVYIDAVTNVPDVASIIKVTGRVVNVNEMTNIPDILAVPKLDSSARNPHFMYRLVVNEDRQQIDQRAAVLLRVYTIEMDTKKLAIIGNCAFDLFDRRKGFVKLGCFTRALRYGLPVEDGVHGQALDGLPKIPATKIYFRILKHSEAPVWRDSLIESDYQLIDGPPTDSDVNVQRSHSRDSQYPRTVKDAATFVQMQDAGRQSVTSANAEWIARRLDRSLFLPPEASPGNLELSRTVRYRKETGLNVQVVRAYSLPEGYVVHCAAFLAPGQTDSSRVLPTIPFCLHTSEIDVESLQSSPVWLDRPVVINPDPDARSCIVIQLCGLDVRYLPTADHSGPGKLERRDRQYFTTVDNMCIGWTVLSLFQGSFVSTGEHHLKIIRGRPTPELLTQLMTRRAESVLKSPSLQQMEATLVVRLWDGHFHLNQLPGGLKEIGKSESNSVLDNRGLGRKRISQLLLDGLNLTTPDDNLDIYEKERAFFQGAIREAFQKLLQQSQTETSNAP